MPDEPHAASARFERSTWIGVDPSEDQRQRPPLSRSRIVRAALRLVDDRGLEALTMRALAHELEVSPMALYNHVRDKDELVDLMVDLMLGEVDCTATEGGWVTQLRALVCSYHQVLSAHHALARVYSDKVRIGPHGLMIIERVLELLRGAGFSPSDTADGFLALFIYTVGFHQMGRIQPGNGPTPRDRAGYYEALPREQIPWVTALAPYLGSPRRQETFEYGLDVLLAGLCAKLTATTAAPQATALSGDDD